MELGQAYERARALFLIVWTHPAVVAVSVIVVKILGVAGALVSKSLEGAKKMPGWLMGGVIAALVTLVGGWIFIENIKDEVRSQERAACTLRIADIEKRINADADAKIKAALDAAEATSPTPEVLEEIAALCAKDAACRDRNQ